MERFVSERDIDQMISDLVGRTREKYGITFGMSGVDACACLGVPLLYGDLENRDGFYERKSQQITINQSRMGWSSLSEFTIYHEIMHHLLERDGELLDRLHEMLLIEEFNVLDRAREDACNAGAAEFLAPRNQVLKSIAEHGLTVDLMEHVAENFGTGLVASVIQVGRCAPIDCYAVICEQGQSRYLPNIRNVLRIEYAAWPRREKFPLARYSPIADDHLFHHVWKTGEVAEGDTYVPFPSTRDPSKYRKECQGEAKRLGSRIVGLLKVGREVPKNQLRLNI